MAYIYIKLEYYYSYTFFSIDIKNRLVSIIYSFMTFTNENGELVEPRKPPDTIRTQYMRICSDK